MFYAVIHGPRRADVYDSLQSFQDATAGQGPSSLSRTFQTSELAWKWICDSADQARDQPVNVRSPASGSGPNSDPHDALELSDEQCAVVDLCLRGESVFFTGSAGTGKSVCLRQIIARLRERHADDGVYVTASTGIAAINVGGTTLHSFAGIGLGKEPMNVLMRKMTPRSRAAQRWESARVLVIDEISMIDGRLFDKLEELARRVRSNERPFGGIQLIICGDFFQLPPVPDSLGGQKIPIKFAFEAESWSRCVPNMITLKKVFRQKDNDLIACLNMMRIGHVDHLGLAIFKQLKRVVKYADNIAPTELFPLRKQVDGANVARLDALPGELMSYSATDIPGYDMHGSRIAPDKASKLLDDTLAPRTVKLKVGAQVMLTKNMSNSGLVNGSLGIVIAFDTPNAALDEGVNVARPDDAKGQGPEFDLVDVEIEGGASNGSSPTRINHSRASPRWPIVQFTNGIQRLIGPEPFEATNAIGKVEATRQQVPLILAWAMSIHKSQGQTIERVKVNLDGVFEKGQAYVAISRATGLEGLQVVGFKDHRIMAHERVIAWSQNMAAADEDVQVTDANGAKDERASDEEYWAEY